MINWEEQWASFAHGFANGKAHIELPNGKEIQLLPGPGFGDYSHPTTQLMIAMMAEHLDGEEIFDIGCGSGILSVAAAKMGARKVYACDIDPEAVAHTVKNGELNGVKIELGRPSGAPAVLMNMIQSEQEVAWKKNRCPFSKLITSGILLSDLDNYMISTRWKLIDQKELSGWVAFIFKDNR